MPLGGHFGWVCRGICHGHHALLLRPEGVCSYFGICRVSATRSARASASFLRAGLLRQGPHVGPSICHGICRLYIYVMSNHKYILFWDHVSARRSAGYIYIACQPLNSILGICHEVCRLFIYMVSYTHRIAKSAYSGICHEICQLYIYVTFGPWKFLIPDTLPNS